MEQKFKKSGAPRRESDARLIAYDVTDRQIDLDNHWGGRELPWASQPTGWADSLPRVWRPPSYNDRIPAQDSGFLLGGIPGSKNNRWYRRAPGDGTNADVWPMASVRRITSLPLRMNALGGRAVQPNSTPTFTIRIPAAVRPEAREVLDQSFGINTSSVYPDMYGLAARGFRDVEVP